eukprot:CAMPEP_0206184598 /NCGR_PEP_ID=MMETSP0166-20121206/1317_1 /ASSEMBLY_ACC=CAM_ASM_000260 /TAXON_ID=95228 /ORGANISM="Vannella robusta, Strain DIVA3 518/3/11/1/6" /LENGTH=414 /DNA_ID=CAMNT_0053599651 /DNA_START=24 /DNA_END=1268 /DNA_ORIENTATION=+
MENIYAAAKRIEGGIVRSSCRRSRNLSALTGCDIFLKAEYMQNTGSFKERGALNSILQLPINQRKKGIIAASAGNHALALAYHGGRLNVPVTVVMPIYAPQTKVANCKSLGANVIAFGSSFTDATTHARELAEKYELTYIHGFDHPPVIAGQGSVGLEILEQQPDIDAVFVPVGGGGLIAGLALAIKSINPDIDIIGVEPVSFPSLIAALYENEPVELEQPSSSTIADGLAVKCVGANVVPLCRQFVDRVVTVEEHYIALSVLRMIELEKAVVEGAGAAGLAPLLAGMFPEYKGKKVCLVTCGGNIDVTLLGRVIDHGLAADGRLVRFRGKISDKPGGLAKFCDVVGRSGSTIRQIFHDRTFQGDDFSMVRVEVTVCTVNQEQAEELLVKFNEAGFPTQMLDFMPHPANKQQAQ